MGRTFKRLRHDIGYIAVRALLGGARAVPLGLLRAGGRVVALLAWWLAVKDRRRAREHLAIAFADRPRAERERILAGARRHLGQLLGEVAWLWSVGPETLLAHTEFVGLENLTDPLEKVGVVLITAHCGNWEWMNLALGAHGVPMTMATREVYDPRIDAVAQRLRSRFGGEPVARGRGAGGRLLVALRRCRVVGLLIDQDIDAPGTFVDFFGKPAWTPSGAAVIALRARSPVVAGFATRLPDGRMRLAFDAPIQIETTGDAEVDGSTLTALLTARIESQIRAHPEQWVWMHRRWRRRPGPDDRVWLPPPGGSPAESGAESDEGGDETLESGRADRGSDA